MMRIFREPQRVPQGNPRSSLDMHVMSQEMTSFFGTAVSTGGSWVCWFPGGEPNTHNQEHRACTDVGFHVLHCMFIPVYYFLNNYFHKHMPKLLFLVAEQCSTVWIYHNLFNRVLSIRYTVVHYPQ